MCMYTDSRGKSNRAVIAKVSSDVFIGFQPPCWFSIGRIPIWRLNLSSINLRGTFRQITQERCIAQT